MNEQQLRFAQREIFKAGDLIGSAGMRLRGTEYEQDYKKVWNALNALNDRLIRDIRKGL